MLRMSRIFNFLKKKDQIFRKIRENFGNVQIIQKIIQNIIQNYSVVSLIIFEFLRRGFWCRLPLSTEPHGRLCPARSQVRQRPDYVRESAHRRAHARAARLVRPRDRRPVRTPTCGPCTLKPSSPHPQLWRAVWRAVWQDPLQHGDDGAPYISATLDFSVDPGGRTKSAWPWPIVFLRSKKKCPDKAMSMAWRSERIRSNPHGPQSVAAGTRLGMLPMALAMLLAGRILCERATRPCAR